MSAVTEAPTSYPHDDRETDILPGEVWKQHPTWTTIAVSNLGRVYNQKTGRFLGYRGHRGNRGVGTVPQDPALPYRRVGVAKTTSYAHLLVLETFVGPRPENHDADHLDHDRLNNRVENLRWRLASENRADTSRRTTKS